MCVCVCVFELAFESNWSIFVIVGRGRAGRGVLAGPSPSESRLDADVSWPLCSDPAMRVNKAVCAACRVRGTCWCVCVCVCLDSASSVCTVVQSLEELCRRGRGRLSLTAGGREREIWKEASLSKSKWRMNKQMCKMFRKN